MIAAKEVQEQLYPFVLEKTPGLETFDAAMTVLDTDKWPYHD